jgi:hypothetical protein
MKARKRIISFLLAGLSPLALHAKGKKPDVAEAIGKARSVYVEAVEGQQFDRNLDPQERMTIADVQDALQAWKRYRLVTQREDADIVIVVRRGHWMDSEPGMTPMENPNRGTDPNNMPGSLPNRGMDPNASSMPGMQRPGGPVNSPGMQTGATEDVFEVCQVNVNGKLTRPLWSRTMENGLREPRLFLFQQFRDAVDKAYPIQPAAPQTKPETKP